MEASRDVETQGFLTRYRTILEEWVGETKTEKKIVGSYVPLIPDRYKTPVPCIGAFSITQMFQTTPNIQQCVRMVVQVGIRILVSK